MIRSWTTVVTALLAAALSGSFALSVEAALLVAWNALSVGGPDAVVMASQAVFLAVTGVIFVGPVFLIGLVAVGAPAWLMITATQVRSRKAAVFVGAFLAGASAAIVLALFGLGSPWWISLLGGAALLLPGAVSGWTLHRVAYGPSRETA